MEISELPTPVPPEIYTYAAAEENGDGGEAEQPAACVIAEKLSTKESDIETFVYENKVENIQDTSLSAKEEVLVDKSLSRESPGHYEREEKSYENWMKLL